MVLKLKRLQICWDGYNAPNVTGAQNPKPAKVDKKIVDGNTQDQTVDIYY